MNSLHPQGQHRHLRHADHGGIGGARRLGSEEGRLHRQQARRAGAIILGKGTLTEFANFIGLGMPTGFSSQDTAGPMARTVTDAAKLLGVLAGFDEKDSATASIATMTSLGATFEGCEIPSLGVLNNHGTYLNTYLADKDFGPGVSDSKAQSSARSRAEAARAGGRAAAERVADAPVGRAGVIG